LGTADVPPPEPKQSAAEVGFASEQQYRAGENYDPAVFLRGSDKKLMFPCGLITKDLVARK
jgi:hypothetical protein